MIQTFGFDEALRLLKRGYRVARLAYGGQAFLEIFDNQIVEDNSREGSSGRDPTRRRADHLRLDRHGITSESILAEDWHLVDREGGT